MSTWWKAGDAIVTVKDDELVVAGDDAFASLLRAMAARGGDDFAVRVGPPPGGFATIRASTPWLVDRWVREEAARRGLELETNYEPTDEDVPGDVREIWAEAEAAPEFDDDGNPTVF